MKDKITKVKIGEIRAQHVEEIIQFNGKVVQVSDVRPQVVNSKFECVKCGKEIEIPQIGKIFQRPLNCPCGNNSNFKDISKEIVDTQRIIVEELPEGLIKKEQPNKINVFLKEDLTSYEKRKTTFPGNKITVIGTLKMIPVIVDDELSVRFDLAIEARDISLINED